MSIVPTVTRVSPSAPADQDPGSTPTDLRFGIVLGSAARDPQVLVDLAQGAERLGFDSVWSSEAWGWDAFSPLNYVAAVTRDIRLGTAIAQISARTPGATAMAALTTQALSGGRLLLGLGVSGPQVVEGWHGVPFDSPVGTTREYLHVLRAALAGEKVEFHGRHFDIPYRGDRSTGQGKALRTSMPPAPDTPLLVAAIGPRNVAMAVEHADGLLPYLWSPTRWSNAWGDELGAAKPGFTVAPTVLVSVGDDLDACRDALRPRLALHIGGMGSRDANFYADLVRRYGYEAEADLIQDRFLAGDRSGAAAAVSDELVDDLALVGPPERVREQLDGWRSSPVDLMLLEMPDAAMLDITASAVLG
jgi:F420-dependent oxidoreductase-like protein